MARKLTGQRLRRRRRTGEQYWQVYVRVQPGPGGFKSQAFPLTATLQERRAWQQDQIGKFGGRKHEPGSFADKVQDYLRQNASKKAINQAAAHLELWLQALGRDRNPLSITKDEINLVIDGWLKDAGPPPDPKRKGRRPAQKGYAPGTVRKRRMWLRQFFVFLTGVDGGPCQKATNPKGPKPGPRGIDMLVCERAIAAMPVRRSAKKGIVGVLSLAPIRARVMLHTGLPPGLVMDVLPEHLDFHAGTLYVAGRDKGDGVEERTVKLMPDALAAWRDFHAANAYGTFSISSLGRSVKAGFKRSGYLRALRLYDVRHSFLTFVYRVTRDLATVGRLGLHAEGSTQTARYALGANQDVDEAAVTAMSQVLAERRRGILKDVPGSAPGKKLPRKVARFR